MAHHPKTEQFIRSGLFSDLESFVDLEKRISLIDDEKTKGDAFEVFASGYLATRPAQRVKNIWPTTKLVPHSVLQRLRLRSNDFGVDGVIQTQSGSYRGYQVKFRTTRPSMTWSEVSSFFGLTDKCDDRLLFCNSDDVSGVAEERKDFLSIRGSDLDNLEKKHFERILAYLTRKKIPHKRFSPFPYQKEALEKLEISFKDNRVDRATIISACGTGKTLLALFAAEAHAKKTVLVLVPSLALLKQTLLEWLQHTSWNKYDYLCVCSDKTVVLDSDELIVRPTELEFSVTTQVEKVRKFLDHPFNGIKIVLSTYDSSNVVAEAMKKDESFELGIFDEAHKTAGVEGSKYSFALSNENLRIKKRLFLTATPKSYFLDPNKRDADGEPTLRYSMDQPSIYGEVIHKLSFHEAAKRKIICNYKVVISVVISSPNRKKLKAGSVMIHGDKVKASQVATQIALSKSVTSRNLHKIFSFHSNIRSAKSFTSNDGDGIIHHLSKFKTFHVNGAMTTAERDSRLKEFKDSKYGVISNARCLTEGVNVPSVDMVAFMAPKRSKIDIVQAVGRAMRNSKETNKKYGYVFVPLFVEQNTDESIEDAVERTGFEEVWAVLQAMQEQDEVLNEIIHQLSADKQITKGFDPKKLTPRLEIDGPIFILEKLRKSIITKLIDHLTLPWDEMVQVLVLYKKRFHHLRVPIDAPKPWDQLGLWVGKVRSLKRNNHLRIERKNQLDQMGFIWRFDGETLDDTTGLLNESQFRKESGLWMIAKYREDKLIIPVGTAMTLGGRISSFYDRKQIPELRKKLGITLENTDGLLNEKQFRRESGLTGIARYREQKLIIPFGTAITNAGLSYYYHPKQIPELRKKIGITLENTDGLLSENQFMKASGLTRVAKYRKQKLIIPVGRAMSATALSYFYNTNQIPELRKKLGITLENTDGLLSENQFMKESGLTKIDGYRKQKLIIPVGRGMTLGGRISSFYDRKQIPELRKKLGITLENTDGLLNEKQFRRESGLTGIARYREQKLIIPFGTAITNAGLSYYYHPKQIPELRKTIGITLENTDGLLNENQFKKESGLTNIGKYRKDKLIIPVGTAMTLGSRISYFYNTNQIPEIRKKLGITLENTDGLLNEAQFMKESGLSRIAKYREEKLINPVGKAMSLVSISYYYNTNQIPELRKKLGITLENTDGLLNEKQFRRESGLTGIARYREQKLIIPVGTAMAGSGLSYFYRRIQIPELRKNLGITLENTDGLLSENQIMKESGLSRISKYRKQKLIIPVGTAMVNSGVTYFYNTNQIPELRKKLGITLENTDGLLNEKQFRRESGLTGIARYREQKLIIPFGTAMTLGGRISSFYDRKQIPELRNILKNRKTQKK